MKLNQHASTDTDYGWWHNTHTQDTNYYSRQCSLSMLLPNNFVEEQMSNHIIRSPTVYMTVVFPCNLRCQQGKWLCLGGLSFSTLWEAAQQYH